MDRNTRIIDAKAIVEGRMVCADLCTSNDGDKPRSKSRKWFVDHQKDHVPLDLLDTITETILHLFDENVNHWDEIEVEMLHYAMSMLTSGSAELESRAMSTDKSNAKKKRVQITKAEFKSARNTNITKLLNICFSGVLNEEKFQFSLPATGLAHLMNALNCARLFHKTEAAPYAGALQADLSKKFAFVRDCFTRMIDEEKSEFLTECSNQIFDWEHDKSKDLERTFGSDVLKYMQFFNKRKLYRRSETLFTLKTHAECSQFLERMRRHELEHCQNFDIRALEIRCRFPSALPLTNSMLQVIDQQAMKDCDREGDFMVLRCMDLIDYMHHSKLEHEKTSNYCMYASNSQGIWRALWCVGTDAIDIQADHGLGALTVWIHLEFKCQNTENVLRKLLYVPVAVAQIRSVLKRRPSLTNEMRPILSCPEARRQETAAKRHKPCQYNLYEDLVF